jgi:2,3-bisphosphoglycerate-dependent phosphoglycerate mutase
MERTLPYWRAVIGPAVRSGRRVLVVAHGNSLRGLMKHLDNIADEDIPGVEIPTGTPLVYELDSELRSLRRHYLDSGGR